MPNVVPPHLFLQIPNAVPESYISIIKSESWIFILEIDAMLLVIIRLFIFIIQFFCLPHFFFRRQIMTYSHKNFSEMILAFALFVASPT